MTKWKQMDISEKFDRIMYYIMGFGLCYLLVHILIFLYG